MNRLSNATPACMYAGMIRTGFSRAFALFTVLVLPLPAHAQPIPAAIQARIDRILTATPLIDGHNDLPEQLRGKYGNDVEGTDVASHADRLASPLMTDMARMRAGRVGGQFWSVYIPADVRGDRAIRETVEQIDVVGRLVAKYPRDLERATTAADVVRIHKAGRIASLIGIEGGHQIGGSMAALRMFHALGARSMTLAHFLNSDIADSATDNPVHDGLSQFGKAVVGEMNRLGMIVDLSHVSPDAMKAALAITQAPVMFSHSDARALNDHPRNVPDDILALVSANGGVVMVNFYPGHLSAAVVARNADRAAHEAKSRALFNGQPDRVKAAMRDWDALHPVPETPIAVVADHIDHIARVAGHDAVGLGGDLDGIDATVPGLDGVDGYPRLFAELIRRGWTDANLAKLAGGNMLRVMRGVEAAAAAMKGVPPSQAVPTAISVAK